MPSSICPSNFTVHWILNRCVYRIEIFRCDEISCHLPLTRQRKHTLNFSVRVFCWILFLLDFYSSQRKLKQRRRKSVCMQTYLHMSVHWIRFIYVRLTQLHTAVLRSRIQRPIFVFIGKLPLSCRLPLHLFAIVSAYLSDAADPCRGDNGILCLNIEMEIGANRTTNIARICILLLSTQRHQPTHPHSDQKKLLSSC